MVVQVISTTQISVIHYTGGEQLTENVDSGTESQASSFSSFSFSVGRQAPGEIKEEIVGVEPSEIHILEYKQQSLNQYSVRDALSRARSRLGEQKYNVVTNNCEHFVNWAKTGESQSSQTQAGAQAIADGITAAMECKNEVGGGWAVVLGGVKAVSSYLNAKQQS